MKNVILEDISISNVDELSTVIQKVLNQCKDTQIFISDELFKRLLKANKGDLIWGEAVLDSFHYCDKVEKAFLFNFINNGERRTLQMHFAENCSGFMHLTYFATKGILYRHYLKGMKRILVIYAD